ncbi:MAG: hypothetical protein KJ043_10110 [Anaerolineae bacterium]|nr:hypothetical protein [Anaerolineae bacterium]
MKTRLSFLLLSIMALLLVVILTAFTNTPHIAQDSVQQTETAIYARATEIVRGATLTAQVGGDMTQFSGGTSTPLAGLCNAYSYRRLMDVEAHVNTILTDVNVPPTEIEIQLLESTADCISFNQLETSITILVELEAIVEIEDEVFIGDTLSDIIGTIAPDTLLATLPKKSISIGLRYGAQTRLFEVLWVTIEDLAMREVRGQTMTDFITSAGVGAR